MTFRILLAVSCFYVFSAEIVVQEGTSLLIEEGTTLSITCLTNTTEDIDFLFGSLTLGSCYYLLGLCSTSNNYNFAVNIGSQPYQYGLASKTGVDTSFCGTYYCQDVPDTFRDSIEVSVTAFDNNSFVFLEEDKRISLTTTCILHATKDDMTVEWFSFDNITLTKLNLSLLADIVDTFLTDTICTDISCGNSSANNISTGLTFKSTTKQLAHVYIQVQLSHPDFPTKRLTQRTRRTYPLTVVQVVPDTPENGLTTVAVVLIIISSLVIAFLCIMLLAFMKLRIPNKGKIKDYTTFIWWKMLEGEKVTPLCIAGCKELICEIDTLFRNNWSEQWKTKTSKKWNEATFSEREEILTMEDSTIRQILQGKNVFSKALNCVFKSDDESLKTEIYKYFYTKYAMNEELPYVFNGWMRLTKSQKEKFVPILVQCPTIQSLLWYYIECRLKIKLCFHYWSSLSIDVQKTFCEMILNSNLAKTKLAKNMDSIFKGSDYIINDIEKDQDATNEEIDRLQSFLSKCEPDQCSKIFEDIHNVIDLKEDNETIDELFQGLSKDLKLEMMKETDQTGQCSVFLTSPFWQKWSEHGRDIPLYEVCRLGLFISSCYGYKHTIAYFKQMNWITLNKVLPFSTIRDIFLYLEWGDICQTWTDTQWNKDTTQYYKKRHLDATSGPSEGTSQGKYIACEGIGNDSGVTSIALYFDDNKSRIKEPCIAATIKSTTCMPLCQKDDLNDVIIAMFKRFELSFYLRNMPGLEGSANKPKGLAAIAERSADKAKGSTDKAKEDILKVLGNDIFVNFHGNKEERPREWTNEATL